MNSEPFRDSIPEGLDIQMIRDEPVIIQSWYTSAVWFLLIFAIVWDSFLVCWYTNLIFHGMAGNQDKGPLWIAFVFPIGHIAVGFGITYFVICSFINSTKFILGHEHVQVKSGPLPWMGNITVPISDIRDVTVRIISGNRGGNSYKVIYVNAQNREKSLYSGFRAVEQAEYVQKYLQHLYLQGK